MVHFNSPRDWFETCGIKKHYSEGANLLGRAENYFCYLHIYLVFFFFRKLKLMVPQVPAVMIMAGQVLAHSFNLRI